MFKALEMPLQRRLGYAHLLLALVSAGCGANTIGGGKDGFTAPGGFRV